MSTALSLIGAKDNHGHTVLHEAAWSSHSKVVSLLLECSTELEAKDNNGDTSLNLTISEGHKAGVAPQGCWLLRGKAQTG